ncbi:HAD-IIIC family phosphatase [Micromonospora sp. NPDC050200]|uniref:HAD-IIIC family phosphatase n=1 Tax=Micromonospora sp. NPDC050200 TaxID=3155664 RepID=UPI0033CF8C38
MRVEELLFRIRGLRGPDTAPDPTVAPALVHLDGAPPATVATAGRLLAGVPADRLASEEFPLRPLRVAVTGTFTPGTVEPLLRVALLRAGITPEIHVSGFDQLVLDLSDPRSELAEFRPDVTLCLLHDGWFLPAEWDPGDLPGLGRVLTDRAEVLAAAVRGFTAQQDGAVLLHTVPLSPLEHRTVISFRGRAELGRAWRKLNGRLLELGGRDGAYTMDLEALLVDHDGPVRDERLYRFASMAWTPTVERRYAAEAATFCRAVLGRTAKVLALDLDNTLWAGVLGDDGLAGIQLGTDYPGNCHRDVQRRALALRRQGVLLTVCSKNDPDVVAEAFDRHPDLLLRADDFVAQAVNWGRKDDNLRQLAETLNLGLDAVVFADDSAFECELVRRELPAVRVVELAGDPAGFAGRLLTEGHFTVLATGATDRDRTELYRARAGREDFAATFRSAEDYLHELKLRVGVRPVDELSLPRLAQLGLRTNQFTMTDRAHTEAQTRQRAASPDHLVLTVEVADRFGTEGLVGGVWLDRAAPDHWVVENFVLSCRVFSRGIEQAVLHRVIELARAAGAHRLEALFRPTARNKPGGACWPAAGFTVGSTHEGTTRHVLPLDPPPRLLPAWIVLEEEGGVRA